MLPLRCCSNPEDGDESSQLPDLPRSSASRRQPGLAVAYLRARLTDGALWQTMAPQVRSVAERRRNHLHRSGLGLGRLDAKRYLMRLRRGQRSRGPGHNPAPTDWLEWWLDLTGSAVAGSPGRPSPGPLSPGAARLRARLLHVLDDATEEGSLPPPTAGEMSQEIWDALTETEKNVFRGRQLRLLDPRLVARAVRNPSGPFDRSPRTSSR